jgi:hypothetical protein
MSLELVVVLEMPGVGLPEECAEEESKEEEGEGVVACPAHVSCA